MDSKTHHILQTNAYIAYQKSRSIDMVMMRKKRPERVKVMIWAQRLLARIRKVKHQAKYPAKQETVFEQA